VVLIEPLASMAQVEDFLWPRVQPPAAGGGAGAGAGAAGAGAASDPHSRQAQHAQQGAAAAAAAADASTLAGGGAPSGGRPASRGQPIPQPAGGRRLTRAQARAAAEAEVEAQGGEGEGDDGEDDGGDAASEDIADELVIEPGSAGGGAAALAAAAAAEAAGLAGMEGLEEDEDYDEEDDDDDEMGDGYVEGEGDEYDEGERHAACRLRCAACWAAGVFFSCAASCCTLLLLLCAAWAAEPWRTVCLWLAAHRAVRFTLLPADDEGMDAAAMHVHDMHLGEEEEAAAAAAAPAAAASPPGPSGRRRRAAKAAATAAAAAAAATAAATAASAARSYASAAAAGAAGTAAAAAPHLVFYMNGRPLPTGSTIFQAVQASVGAGSSGSQAAGADVSSRLWGEVHTLTYRSQAAAAALRAGAGAGAGGGVDEVEVEGPAGGSAAAVTAAAGSPEASPLAELLAPCEVLAGGGGGGGGALEGASADVLDVLSVLRVVEAVNRLAPQLVAALAGRAGAARDASAPPPGHVPRDAFVSGRLGPKLAAQLKDVLSICGGALPPWCGALAARARFLFPFDVRRRYFYCTSFGLPRALHYLQQAHAQEHGPGGAPDRDTGGLRMGRVQRQKVRISRRRLLDSAHKVFELYAAPKSQLEVEFFDEAGTGLGPTLEFYTLLSHELQRRSLGLWRDDGPPPAGRAAKPAAGAAAPPAPRPPARAAAGPGPLRGELARGGGGAPGDEGVRDRDLVAAPLGLFPAPLAPGAGRADAARGPRHFRLLGRVVAKALQDCRLLDLPLAPLLYRLALGRAAGLYDVRAVDAALGATLERLAAAAAAGPAAAVDGCPVADLCLSFVLPGRPDYPLRPGGADVAVTAANLREYVDAVVDATLGSGVAAQVAAFRAGFAAILPPEALAPFYEDEVEAMVCGTGEAWTPEGLAQVVRFDHGYTSSSATAAALLQVLAGLDAVDQRRFVRFVTGTPRLPAGGLAALQPRLTVVRKLSAAAAAELGGSAPGGGGTPRSDPGGALPAGGLGGAVARSAADGDLPSVMTCANYLKLPPYSSVAALRERLLFAIREGQGSFDLS
jgi:E3 ubiquitin-protein ligase TRIP12